MPITSARASPGPAARSAGLRSSLPLRELDAATRRALRALLAELAAPAPTHDDEEVVLSVELDGMRYTLAHQRMPQADRSVALSAREHEIARLISAGHTNKTVAAVLEISLWTVDTHIRRIFAKLGVRSRSAMVARLAESGLLAAPADSSWPIAGAGERPI